MSNRRARTRAGRTQRAVAIILLLCLVLSGLAVYAATISIPATPHPIQQGH